MILITIKYITEVNCECNTFNFYVVLLYPIQQQALVPSLFNHLWVQIVPLVTHVTIEIEKMLYENTVLIQKRLERGGRCVIFTLQCNCVPQCVTVCYIESQYSTLCHNMSNCVIVYHSVPLIKYLLTVSNYSSHSMTERHQHTSFITSKHTVVAHSNKQWHTVIFSNTQWHTYTQERSRKS